MITLAHFLFIIIQFIIIKDHRKDCVNEDGEDEREMKDCINEDGVDDREGVGKGDSVTEIHFITITVRFNIREQNIPQIKIDMSNKATVKELRELVIEQKPFLKPNIEQMCFIFAGKLINNNDLHMIDIVKNHDCLEMILSGNDEMVGGK